MESNLQITMQKKRITSDYTVEALAKLENTDSSSFIRVWGFPCSTCEEELQIKVSKLFSINLKVVGKRRDNSSDFMKNKSFNKLTSHEL